jgi:hypothetical protein
MTLIEELDAIITLLDSSKHSPAEIKGKLLAVREQLEAQSNAAEELKALKLKYAAQEQSAPNWGSQPRIKGRMES